MCVYVLQLVTRAYCLNNDGCHNSSSLIKCLGKIEEPSTKSCIDDKKHSCKSTWASCNTVHVNNWNMRFRRHWKSKPNTCTGQWYFSAFDCHGHAFEKLYLFSIHQNDNAICYPQTLNNTLLYYNCYYYYFFFVFFFCYVFHWAKSSTDAVHNSAGQKTAYFSWNFEVQYYVYKTLP